MAKGPVAKTTMPVADRADEALQKSAEAYADAKSAVAHKIDETKACVTDAADAAKAKAYETHEKARDYVRENPERSIGIAAAVGALIGAVIALIITRR